MKDTRNVLDEFKEHAHAEIVEQLDERGVELEIAVENTIRDGNMGSIVRTANAFGVRVVHVIGRKQWNKRGAMATDKYLHVLYHASVSAFSSWAQQRGKVLKALECNVSSTSIYDAELPKNMIWVFGQEGPGISDELLAVCDEVITIPQLGSTRSMNVGHAAAIAIFEWSRRNNQTEKIVV